MKRLRQQGGVRSTHLRHSISRSPEETHNLGFQIAQDLRVPGIVLLRGALGTGKTTLARGIACGLGLDDPTVGQQPFLHPGQYLSGTLPDLPCGSVSGTK